MCPSCHAAGDVSDCDSKIQNKPCYEEEPVCALVASFHSSYYGPQIDTQRLCVEKKLYLKLKESCVSGRCAMAMCDTSGCMAKLTSGK